VAAVRGFADRDSRDRQTRRSPTHSHLWRNHRHGRSAFEGDVVRL